MFANQRNLNSENFTSLHKRTRWTTLKTTVDPKDSPNTLRLSTESSTQIKAPQSSDAIHPGQDKPALQISLQAPSTCRLCHRELNIRFTCIDCSVNFCFTCRMLHFTGHTIVEEAVTNNVSVRDDISLRNNISVGDDVGDPESGNTNPNKNDNKFDDIKDMLPVTWRKDFERMMEEVMTRAATKAAIKAAPKILKRLGRRSESGSLLDFNIRDALKSHNIRSPDIRTGRRSATSHQLWTDAGKRQLHRLKRKGYTNDKIAIKMCRSAGAVAQQWRKQYKLAKSEG